MELFIKLKDRVINPAHLITLWKTDDQKAIRVETTASTFYIYYSSVDEMKEDFEKACEALA